MKKLLLMTALLVCFCQVNNVEGAIGWLKTKPAGTSNASDIDTYVGENNAALDLMLSKYRQGCLLSYASASTLTVGTGGVMVSNADASVRLMLANTSATTISWTDIDQGSEAISTTYYVYVIASATTDTTFTCKISTSSSAPNGVTYYVRLGSFYNDASGNITNIVNDNFPIRSYDSGWFAVSTNTAYTKTHNLSTTKVLVSVYFSDTSDGTGRCVQVAPADSDSGTQGQIGLAALTATIATIRTGAGTYIVDLKDYNGTTWQASSGYCRLIIQALE